MLKAFIITQEEPFFIPKMIQKLTRDNNSFKVIGATVLKPHRKNKSISHWVRERTKIYSWGELLITFYAYIITKAQNKVFKQTSKYSPSAIFKKNQVPILVTNDINSSQYLNKLKDIHPDVIISISCPQLFRDELLKLPRLGCFNAHGTLLPRHRGVFGSWWTLYSGDAVGGSTIHRMVLKLDAGEIVWQKEFPLTPEDTQYSIAFKTKRDMSEGIIDVLAKLAANQELKAIEPHYTASYHKAPTKNQGKLFRKKGLKIIRPRDLKYIFHGSYV